jgi:hypothetical protein
MGSDAVIASSIVAVVVLAVIFAVRSTRRAKVNRLQLQQALGLTPVEPTAELTSRVNRLYHTTRRTVGDDPGTYVLRNVSGRSMSDGALFVLDVIETSQTEDNLSESQTILIASPDLELPPFVMFPRVDVDGALPGFANRVIDWVVSKWGDPVGFPDSPEFERRYVVSSTDQEATWAFLAGELLRGLAETRLLIVHAAGDTFAVSRVELARKPALPLLEERINEAVAVFSLFRSRSLELR